MCGQLAIHLSHIYIYIYIYIYTLTYIYVIAIYHLLYHIFNI